MGLFEDQPWLLVPIILVVVIGYDAVKWGVRRLLDRIGEPASRERPS
jgi:hypothetical protein